MYKAGLPRKLKKERPDPGVHPIDIMNILIFGATGMVGQGVLRECLLDTDVDRVLTLGRAPTGAQHSKLTEIAREDLFNYAESKTNSKALTLVTFALASRPRE
jgi:hypothetical protein